VQYTDAERSAIKQEFSRRRRKQYTLAVAFAPLIFAAVGYQRGVLHTILGISPQVAGPMFLVLVIGAALFSLRNWRCPGCSKYLGRGINPAQCPCCRVALRG
jgi:hypothetical protein